MTAGGEPGQPVPAPTASPFWGEDRGSRSRMASPGGAGKRKGGGHPHKKRKPQGESALERSGLGFIRGPVSCGLSRGFLRQPHPARDGLPASGGRPASLPCAAGLEALRSRGRACMAGGPEGGRRETPAPWAAAPGTRECGAARIRRMGSGEHGLHLMLRRRGVRGDEAAFDGLSVHGQGQAALLVAREVANVDAVEAAPEAAGHRYLA